MNPATYRSSGSPISLLSEVSLIVLPEILGELSEIIFGSALNTIVVIYKFTLEIGIKRLSNSRHHIHAEIVCHLPSVECVARSALLAGDCADLKRPEGVNSYPLGEKHLAQF